MTSPWHGTITQISFTETFTSNMIFKLSEKLILLTIWKISFPCFFHNTKLRLHMQSIKGVCLGSLVYPAIENVHFCRESLSVDGQRLVVLAWLDFFPTMHHGEPINYYCICFYLLIYFIGVLLYTILKTGGRKPGTVYFNHWLHVFKPEENK